MIENPTLKGSQEQNDVNTEMFFRKGAKAQRRKEKT
jgi:hypothetical protein